MIRAAYLALMRRYHPDTNPSPDAIERARKVTTAYNVLSDSNKRSVYDKLFDEPRVVSDTPQRTPVGPIFFSATTVILSLTVLAVWLKPPKGTRSEPAVVTASASGAPKIDVGCISSNTAHVLRQKLTLQAIDLRLVDRQTLLAIAAQTVVRIKIERATPSARDPNRLICRADVKLILPLGLTSSTGRRTVSGNVDYSVSHLAGASSPTVTLAPASDIAVQLASLRLLITSPAQPSVKNADSRSSKLEPKSSLAEVPAAVEVTNRISTLPASQARLAQNITTPNPQSAVRTGKPAEKTIIAPAPLKKSEANSSCSNFGTPWTELLCESQNLTALDKQLGSFEAQSLTHANANKRESLRNSWRQFSANRVRCITEACLRRLYLNRIKEVGDIMSEAGRRPR